MDSTSPTTGELSTSGDATTASEASSTSTASTSATTAGSSSSGEPDPRDACVFGEICLKNKCVAWPPEGEIVECDGRTPRPGTTWGRCVDGLCTNGSDCTWLFDGEICPPNDACGFGGCAPDGCTGGTCLATLCFAPCQGPGNCPYEGMACATNRGHICVWPHE